jgi:hypothetical protein
MGWLYRELNLLFLKIVLSNKIRSRADKYFRRTIKEFKNRHHRKPDRDELFSLVVKTSHRTIGIRRLGGVEGHIKRQRIRKYLLLKNRIRKRYRLQKAR